MAESGDGGDRRFGGYVQLAVIAAVAVAGIYFGRAPERATVDPGDALGQPAAPPLVEVVRPERAAHAASVTLTGTVGPHGVISMTPSVLGGRVIWTSPSLRFGGTFSAGEVLLRVDPRDYEMAVADAEAELRGAEARLEHQRLVGEAQTAEFLRSNPGAEVPALVANAARIKRWESRVEEGVIALEGRKLMLSRTNYSLPFDGRITRVQVGVGQVLSNTVPFGSAYARDALEIGAGIDNQDLAYLEPAVGRRATVFADRDLFAGEVVRVGAAVDLTSRLTRLFLKFSDEEPLERLPLPGSFVSVNIEGPEFEDSYLLPNAAEQPGGHIWLVRNGQLESLTPIILRQAVTGWLDSPGWLVRAFDAGDGIVLGTVFGAHEGMRVRIAGGSRS